ncbi:MAG: hypothetical protein ACTSYX_06595 [Candidatus Thorarchaeota archaeon]
MMFRKTASFGDGLDLVWRFSPEECRELFSGLDESARSAGHASSLKRSVGLWTRVFSSRSGLERAVDEEASRRSISIDDTSCPQKSAPWETPDEIADCLEACADVGGFACDIDDAAWTGD